MCDAACTHDIVQTDILLLDVVILLKLCQVWLLGWNIILILVTLKVVIIILLPGCIIFSLFPFIYIQPSVRFHYNEPPWFPCAEIWIFHSCYYKPYLHHKYPPKYCAAHISSLSRFYWVGTTVCYQNCYFGVWLPSSPLVPVGCSGLYKGGELIIGHLFYILPSYTPIPWLSRFRILLIPHSHPGITDFLYLMIVIHIFSALSDLWLYLLNISRCLHISSLESIEGYSISWMQSFNIVFFVNSLGWFPIYPISYMDPSHWLLKASAPHGFWSVIFKEVILFHVLVSRYFLSFDLLVVININKYRYYILD